MGDLGMLPGNVNLDTWPLSSAVMYKSVLNTYSHCVHQAEEGTSALSSEKHETQQNKTLSERAWNFIHNFFLHDHILLPL